MTIHDLAAIHLKAGGTLRSKEQDDSKKVETPGIAEIRNPDRVEISEEARILASQAESGDEAQAAVIQGKESLTEKQILEIRRWVDDGFYDLPTTVEEVARRILESGDLDL